MRGTTDATATLHVTKGEIGKVLGKIDLGQVQLEA